MRHGGADLGSRLASQGRVDLLEEGGTRFGEGLENLAMRFGSRSGGEPAAVGVARENRHGRARARRGTPAYDAGNPSAGERNGAIGRAGQVIGQNEPALRHANLVAQYAHVLL